MTAVNLSASKNNQIDTIVAPATASGQAGVAIIRVSGPAVQAIMQHILKTIVKPRVASLLPFYEGDGSVIDEGIALFFPQPHSFTGEDVLELQGHGGAVVIDMLLQRLLACGARMARPGEFSERAFLNDKLDLTQAEAIADLIGAASTQAARSALRSLQGEFSKQVQAIVTDLVRLRVFVEAAIDFPEEEVDFLGDGRILRDLAAINDSLIHALARAQQGAILREGIQVVIAGKPNAGKSSLLNALAGQERAIVTAIPGTTRDVLRERILIDGIPLHIIDTAGLRETDDTVEQEGVRRAEQEIATADCVLYVNDINDPTPFVDMQQVAKGAQLLVVNNKIDLLGVAPGDTSADVMVVNLSAKTGEGLSHLQSALKRLIGFDSLGEDHFIARRRHLDALRRAVDHIKQGRTQLEQHKAGELLAEELHAAQQALGEITGKFTSDDLLGEIFSNFCIGK